MYFFQVSCSMSSEKILQVFHQKTCQPWLPDYLIHITWSLKLRVWMYPDPACECVDVRTWRKQNLSSDSASFILNTILQRKTMDLPSSIDCFKVQPSPKSGWFTNQGQHVRNVHFFGVAEKKKSLNYWPLIHTWSYDMGIIKGWFIPFFQWWNPNESRVHMRSLAGA